MGSLTFVKGSFFIYFFRGILLVKNMLREERPVILHQGVYKKTATVGEAVFMITGMTIGAGILGLPYAVAQAGLGVGLVMIAVLGVAMLSLHLMIGEAISLTGRNLQLPGLAERYLGKWAKYILSVILIVSGLATLLAYLIGEGVSLAALFGGDPIAWSVIFWSAGSFLIWGGLERVKLAEKWISLTVMSLITLLSLWLLPRFGAREILTFNHGGFLFPFGVILFALHASPAIGEARALLPDAPRLFRRALVIGTLIPVALYMLFTAAVVGAIGGDRLTEVATVAIGARFGSFILIFANALAILAMSSAFMGLGTALRETLEWDYRLPKNTAKFLVAAVPLVFLLLGIRSFVLILDVVGGLFISLEALIMAAVYARARHKMSGLPASATSLFRHPMVLIAPAALIFSGMLVASALLLLR